MKEFKLSDSKRFAFPCAYGGVVESDTPPQIHDCMRKLRRAVGSLEAKKQAGGPMFPVKSAKELNQKLAEALDELNMVAAPVAQEITHLEADRTPNNQRGNSGNPIFRTLAHCKTTVRFIAPDTSFIDCVGSGHGGDVDDKAGGKAATFSWKDAVLKGLTVPHEDMVDTDDDSTVGDSVSRATNAGGRVLGAQVRLDQAADKAEEASDKGLDYALLEIEKSTSEQDLEVVRMAIKSGEIVLHGQQKVEAAKAFSKKMESLKNG